MRTDMACVIAIACASMACSTNETDPAGGGSGGAATTSSTGTGTLPCNAAQEPFGTDAAKGESFADVELTDCDGGKVTLDEVRCHSEITLMAIGAGWCEPCKEEAPHLEAASKKYDKSQVGIIQVMFQDAKSMPATTQFCKIWTESFELTFPVFVDPVGFTLEYFDSVQAPLNVIVDRDGKVLYSAIGAPEDVDALIQTYLPAD